MSEPETPTLPTPDPDRTVGMFDYPCIVAGVILYRQTPERLERLIASLVDRCQGAVFLDGPYEGLSDVASSGEDMYEAIQRLCDEHGVPVKIFAGRVWRGEPEKRTAAAREAFDYARELDPEAEPWLLLLDSDEWLLDDIDAEAVSAYGYGSGLMQSYRDGEPTVDGGTGAKMVRLFPNTPHILWGPAHFDVRDMSIPVTYSGWEKALLNECAPAFTIGHDLGTKTIQAEYDAYNDLRRVEAEGKMMRIVDDYLRGGDEVVIRMDNEQIASGEWRPGMVVSVNGALVGKPDVEKAFVAVREILPVAGHDDLISDIHFDYVTDEQAEELARVAVEAEIAKRVAMGKALECRAAKRLRRLGKVAR